MKPVTTSSCCLGTPIFIERKLINIATAAGYFLFRNTYLLIKQYFCISSIYKLRDFRKKKAKGSDGKR